MSELVSGNLAYPQTKIELFDEVNYELSKDELQEAVKLSGYTKKEKSVLNDEIGDNRPTNTGRMWMAALMGVWKTMMDVDGWKLPGTFNKYNICGKGSFKMCSEHNFVRGFVYHCGRIGCEICAKRAGSRAAKKIERRIWLYGLKMKFDSKDRRNPLASHIIEAIDPRSEFWTWSETKRVQVIKRIRKRVGITSGAEINHLWAFDKNDVNLKPTYRPHKHLIAYGWLKSDAKEIIKKEFGIDMVYHKVRNGTLRSRIDVFAVAYYQLSHAAIKHDKHSIRWFGDLSYRKISNSTLKMYQDEEYQKQNEDIEKSKCCDICNEKLLPARFNKKFDKWWNWKPPDDQRKAGFICPSGLFLSVDFMSGEKLPYYDLDTYEEFYKLKKSEIEEKRNELRPDLYCKKTESQNLMMFVKINDQPVTIPKHRGSSSLDGNDRDARNVNSEARGDSS